MNIAAFNASPQPEYLIGAPGIATATPATTNAAPATTNAALDTAPKPVVRTFDVFDTLIARRCIEPARIFEMVEQRAGISGFAAARRQAEARVAGHAYDLDMIYDALAAMLKLDATRIAAVKALEIDIEKEQIVPIAEHLSQVRHGDVLISDMYLGAPIIRELLTRAGLDKKVSLIVTSDGKKSGAIWPQATANLAIEEHLGDHPQSDNAVPTSFGIAARQATAFRPNAIEDVLLTIGLRQLAELCRETRLSTWAPNPAARTVQVIQAGLNFPMILLASVALARLSQRLGKRSILFSSRDCDSWLPLYDEVARRLGITSTATYFYTSRLTKMQPSPGYLNYARQQITQDALVVDLCGTGWSLAHLAERLGQRDVPVFFLHKLPEAMAYEQRSRTPQTCRFHAIVQPSETVQQNTMLEMCNYADHGMVADVRMINDVAIPVFAEDRRPSETLALVRAQQDTFRTAVSLMSKYDLFDVLGLDDASIAAVTSALYQALSQQMELRTIFGASHTEEEKDVRRQIGCA
jgi:hypothetical protein